MSKTRKARSTLQPGRVKISLSPYLIPYLNYRSTSAGAYHTFPLSHRPPKNARGQMFHAREIRSHPSHHNDTSNDKLLLAVLAFSNDLRPSYLNSDPTNLGPIFKQWTCQENKLHFSKTTFSKFKLLPFCKNFPLYFKTNLQFSIFVTISIIYNKIISSISLF